MNYELKKYFEEKEIEDENFLEEMINSSDKFISEIGNKVLNFASEANNLKGIISTIFFGSAYHGTLTPCIDVDVLVVPKKETYNEKQKENILKIAEEINRGPSWLKINPCIYPDEVILKRASNYKEKGFKKSFSKALPIITIYGACINDDNTFVKEIGNTLLQRLESIEKMDYETKDFIEYSVRTQIKRREKRYNSIPALEYKGQKIELKN